MPYKFSSLFLQKQRSCLAEFEKSSRNYSHGHRQRGRVPEPLEPSPVYAPVNLVNVFQIIPSDLMLKYIFFTCVQSQITGSENLGWVVQKLINTHPGLKVEFGIKCSCVKLFFISSCFVKSKIRVHQN